MELHFHPQLEAELKRVAAERGWSADQLVQEILEAYLDHEKWFRGEVQKGPGATGQWRESKPR